MKNLKEMWKKLKYWQKGGLIGAFLSILLHIYLFLNGTNYGNILDPFNIVNYKLSVSLFTLFPVAFIGEPYGTITLGSVIALLVWYFVLGILLGKIYEIIRKRRVIKNTKLLLAISALSFFILVSLLNILFLVLFIVPRLGFG